MHIHCTTAVWRFAHVENYDVARAIPLRPRAMRAAHRRVSFTHDVDPVARLSLLWGRSRRPRREARRELDPRSLKFGDGGT